MAGNLAPLEVRTIGVGERLITLRRTIRAECIVRRRKGRATVLFRFRPLNLRGKGATRPEAAADFDRGLHDLLELLRGEPVEAQGLALRAQLINYVDPEDLDGLRLGRFLMARDGSPEMEESSGSKARNDSEG